MDTAIAPVPYRTYARAWQHLRAPLMFVCATAVTACVFLVKNRKNGTLHACKLAERRAQRHTWSRLCQLLRHESALLQHIGHHPNIVRWEGGYSSHQQLAIVMELVVGGDCQQLLQRHGALAEDAVHAMTCQLHAALRCVRPWPWRRLCHASPLPARHQWCMQRSHMQCTHRALRRPRTRLHIRARGR